MKLNHLLMLSGLLLAAAPGLAYAGCAASCKNCRYEAAGNYFYCGDTAVKGARTRAVGAAQPSGGIAKDAGNVANSSSARSTGPKSMNPRTPVAHKDEIQIDSIKSPRDAASGQATGRRTYKP